MAPGTTIKAIQDVMRKDTGVDGDAQRIGQLVWMLFLKILDDRELEKTPVRPALPVREELPAARRNLRRVGGAFDAWEEHPAHGRSIRHVGRASGAWDEHSAWRKSIRRVGRTSGAWG